jgi:RNA recognition motif-containing protein
LKIYVYNLSYEVTESNLKSVFSTFGFVKSVNIIKEKQSQISKGFGYIDMPDRKSAKAAIKNLNGMSFKNRIIKIQEAPELLH